VSRWRLGGLVMIAVLAGSGVPLSRLVAQDMTKGSQAIEKSWLRYDAKAKTVHFKLIAGLTGLNGALNFNGFDDGTLKLVVPADSKVVIDFENHDGMLPHSAQVIAPKFPLPTAATTPAIDRASTDKVEEGLPPQAKGSMTFTAAPAGDYLIFCGVPGHGQSGMYIQLKVSKDAKAASLENAPKLAATP